MYSLVKFVISLLKSLQQGMDAANYILNPLKTIRLTDLRVVYGSVEECLLRLVHILPRRLRMRGVADPLFRVPL